jgi:phosphinothricin acetyltransferase
MLTRDAVAQDVPGILAIYNDVIATSTAVYRDEPTSLDERLAWLRGRLAKDFPVLVAVEGDEVLGFSSFGEWRDSPGYRHTVEHSVHVGPARRGAGIGRALVEALFPRALAMGKHVMIGGVDGENDASLRFHARLGFQEVARFRQVGRKFDRWLDLVFVQRFLEAPATASPSDHGR